MCIREIEAEPSIFLYDGSAGDEGVLDHRHDAAFDEVAVRLPRRFLHAVAVDDLKEVETATELRLEMYRDPVNCRPFWAWINMQTFDSFNSSFSIDEIANFGKLTVNLLNLTILYTFSLIELHFYPSLIEVFSWKLSKRI